MILFNYFCFVSGSLSPPTGAMSITRQPPAPCQWLNPPGLTPATLANPAAGAASVPVSLTGNTRKGATATAFLFLSQRCWRCCRTSQGAELTQSSSPQSKFNYPANYIAQFTTFHLFFFCSCLGACLQSLSSLTHLCAGYDHPPKPMPSSSNCWAGVRLQSPPRLT